jgi:hypothetical protein
MSLTRAILLVVGFIIFLSGVSVAGLIKSTDAQRLDYAARGFGQARGQTGFILAAFEDRKVGVALMAIGSAMLVMCWLSADHGVAKKTKRNSFRFEVRQK